MEKVTISPTELDTAIRVIDKLNLYNKSALLTASSVEKKALDIPVHDWLRFRAATKQFTIDTLLLEKSEHVDSKRSLKRKRQEVASLLLEKTGLQQDRKARAQKLARAFNVKCITFEQPALPPLPDTDKQSLTPPPLTPLPLFPAPENQPTTLFTHQRFSIPASYAPKDNKEKEKGEKKTGPHKCYICRRSYEELHHFYHRLCPPCARFNFAKRQQRADLTGRTFLVTGARVKIGYEIALILLRCNASVVVTSRFPNDTLVRYANEADFVSFKTRLKIHALDLRDIAAVETFCTMLLDTVPTLDGIINNAAQTIRRPPIFYRHLLPTEALLPEQLSSNIKELTTADTKTIVSTSSSTTSSSVALSQIPLLPSDITAASSKFFPPQSYDADHQQTDLRRQNSWTLQLPEVSAVELIETQLINAIAPFLLISRLTPLLKRARARQRHNFAFIINVSSMEGKFTRIKNGRHPHTNMAKAALNMLTRTCAESYAAQGILMNAVDTGWVSDEVPVATRSREFVTPIDEIDGAQRVLDPIFSALKEQTPICTFGIFYKDYLPTDW